MSQKMVLFVPIAMRTSSPPTFPLLFSMIVDSPLRTAGTLYITCIVICKLLCKSCVRLAKKISNFDHFALMVYVMFVCYLLSTVKTLPIC